MKRPAASPDTRPLPPRLLQSANACTDFESVWTLAGLRKAGPITPARLHGLTGGIARAAGDTLTFDDFHTLLSPGMAALGLTLRFWPLPNTENSTAATLQAHWEQGVALLVFDGPTETPPNAEAESAVSAEEPPRPPNPLLTQQTVLYAPTELDAVLTSDLSPLDTEPEPSSRLLLTLYPGNKPGARGPQDRAALQRWLAFSEAFPERALSARAADAPLRQLAAQFLTEAAGKTRSPYTTRLRRAASALPETPDSELFYSPLREAICLEMQLPGVVRNALLSPPDSPLSPLARRELIYMARAGTFIVKVMAARRLIYERQYPDARRTLEQLAWESSPWLRAFSHEV